MKKALLLLLAIFFLAGRVSAEKIGSDQEDSFSIIGTFVGVSEKSYLNVHDEEWSLIMKVDKVLNGGFDKSVVYVGVPRQETYGFEVGRQYVLTLVYGAHGLRIKNQRMVE